MGSRPAGFTLVEMAIATVILTLMSLVIIQSMHGLTSTRTHVEGQFRVDSVVERVASRIVADVTVAARVLQHSSDSTEFLGLLEVGPRVSSQSRMPRGSLADHFDVDPTFRVETGNLLCLVRSDGHQVFDIGDGVEDLRRVDLVRIVVYHQTGSAASGLDLHRWCSVRLARHMDLDAVTDPVLRLRLVDALRADGIEYVWEAGAGDNAESLCQLQADGTCTLFPAGHRLPADERRCQFDLLSMRRMRVTPNGALRVPFFANPAVGFPHGFEIKITDDGMSGLLLFRLTIETDVADSARPNRAFAQREISFREE